VQNSELSPSLQLNVKLKRIQMKHSCSWLFTVTGGKDMASIYSSRDTISLRGCVPLRRTLQYELQVAPIPSQTPDLSKAS
jgi:hypothetical protein